MRKSPFLIFIAVIAILITSLVLFIQSTRFAGVVKRVAAKYVPSDIGIEGDFNELSVRLFPPGVSIQHPRLTVRSKNILNLPADSHINADRLDLSFRPFQMFSGDIRIHQVTVIRGDIQFDFSKETEKRPLKQKSSNPFNWDELFQIRAESIVLEGTRVRIKIKEPALTADFMASSVQIEQLSGTKNAGYGLNVDLKDIQTVLDKSLEKSWKIPTSLDSIVMTAKLKQTGLEIEHLDVERQGAVLKMSGKIKGDLLNPKDLMAETEIHAHGDLARMMEFAIDRKKNEVLPSGIIEFKGHARGNLDRPGESFHVDGSLEVENPRYAKYAADRMSVEGAWSASNGGGEISITKVLVAAKEMNRQGGVRAGSGGQIETGAFKFNLGSKEALSVPITLSRAHLHWLAAPVIKSIFAVDTRLTGSANVIITPPSGQKDWNLTAKVDLKAESFQLDNQRLDKVKPLSTILNIPYFNLKGALQVNANAFRPDGLLLSVDRTKFDVTGKVDFKTGFDLSAAGAIDFQEIGTIANTAISGEGTLITHVHGLPERVLIDFDADLKNAFYLNMKLGSLKGRITWDDDPSQLLLRDLHLVKNKTPYNLNGSINFLGSSSLALDVSIPSGNVLDFSQIFENFTKDFWWYPHSINGDMSGKIKVTGGLALNELMIAANIGGPNWEYLGETFHNVSLSGGYDKGKFYLSSLRALKHSGMISGRISFDANQNFDWDFRTDNFAMNDLDHIARLDVPIRGRIGTHSKGKGLEGTLESQTDIHLTDVAVRGVPAASSEVTIKTAGGVAEIRASLLGGQGTFDSSYDFKLGGNSYIRSELKHLDFSPMLLLLNPRAIQDKSLAGTISGGIDLKFRSGEIEKGSGHAELIEYLLAKSGTHFELVRPVQFKIEAGTFDFKNLTVQGNQGLASMDLQGHQGHLNGSVQGELDLSVLEFLTSALSQASGLATLSFRLSGELKEPKLEGTATLSGGTVRIPALETPFENIRGTMQIEQSIISIKSLEADLASGRVFSSGTIELFTNQYPKILLNGSLAGNKLKVFPFQVAKVRGKVSVKGDSLPYLVSGNIFVESAVSREKIFQQQGRGLKTAQYTPPRTNTSESDFPLFKLNIEINAPGNIIVQNELFDAELKGNLTLVNTLEAPRLLGHSEVIQGKLTFKDRVFQIQSASAEFDNPTVINPIFNLTANTDVNNKKIQIYASGRLDNYKVDFTSNPVMAESEILSLLAIGITNEDAKKLHAGDLSAYQQGEAASLLLHSMDFNRDVKDKTGLQIDIDEAVNEQAGSSIFQPTSKSENAAAPKIVIKRQIGSKVDLSVGSTVGVGTNNEKEVNAEIHVTPTFSMIGVWGSLEDPTTQVNSTSYGVDLKVQKRFKLGD